MRRVCGCGHPAGQATVAAAMPSPLPAPAVDGGISSGTPGTTLDVVVAPDATTQDYLTAIAGAADAAAPVVADDAASYPLGICPCVWKNLAYAVLVAVVVGWLVSGD